MDVDISPKLSKKVYGSDGGSYFGWCPNELPMLEKADIGAAKLALEKRGLALPSYSDSAKVAYVLQGIKTSTFFFLILLYFLFLLVILGLWITDEMICVFYFIF